MSTSLIRIKTAEGGVFLDDPDVADPTVALPAGLATGDPDTAFCAYLPNRTTGKVKVKATFRKSDGVEVAGTFTAYPFAVMPLHEREALLGATRPAVVELGPAASGVTSAAEMVIDNLGRYDTFGVRFSSIVAATATRMFVFVEEVD